MVRDNNSILGMDVQSISWLHGTMQCEVKSRCTAPSSRSWLRGALLFALEGDSHMEVSNCTSTWRNGRLNAPANGIRGIRGYLGRFAFNLPCTTHQLAGNIPVSRLSVKFSSCSDRVCTGRTVPLKGLVLIVQV